MAFNDVMSTVSAVLANIGITIDINGYDGVIVKRLEKSNTLEEDRRSNQTHIAITGSMMDFFPYLRADGYFDAEYSEQDNTLKKYFLAQIPVYINKNNVLYIDPKTEIVFEGSNKKVYVSVLRSKRNDGSPQVQLSIINSDSPDFIALRRKIRAGSYMIMLKNNQKLEYEFYVVKDSDISVGEKNLASCNSVFAKLSTSTTVPVEIFKVKTEVVYKTKLDSKYKRNRIIFGAPGTGKSFKLKKDCNEFIDSCGGVYERVTFYPDYTYSQFVGAYKPVMADNDHDIEYKFVQGPFLRVYLEALKSAMSDRPKPCILIIEEINRAKPASVFGDLFQLLDRDKDGVSEYEINTSEEVKRFLARELGGKKEDYSTIRLPNNMFIWATMNSADQGVYPMDTAFKRRWSFEYLGVDKNEDQMPKVEIKMGRTTSTTTDWNLLRKAINAKLSRDIKANEDKLLGPFFISKNLLETVSAPGHTMEDEDEFIEVFKSKVLMYLFEDAGRPNRPKLFEGCDGNLRYSSICEAFDELGMGIFGKGFESDFYEPEKGK